MFFPVIGDIFVPKEIGEGLFFLFKMKGMTEILKLRLINSKSNPKIYSKLY